MTWWEILLSVFYGVTGFGYFVQENFVHTLTLARNQTSSFSEAHNPVTVALWDVRERLEDLIAREDTRREVISLFPSLRDLPALDAGEEHAVREIAYSKLALNAFLWPVMLPINISHKAAQNIVLAEASAQKAQRESYDILADYEVEYAPLAEAFKSGDDERIQHAIVAKAEWQASQEQNKKLAPTLSLD